MYRKERKSPSCYSQFRATPWFRIANRRFCVLRSRPRRFDIDRDAPPPPLPKTPHAQRGASQVAEHNREPDVAGVQPAQLLEQSAQADWDRYLGNERNLKGAPCVALALQASRVSESYGDEESRHAKVSEQLLAD